MRVTPLYKTLEHSPYPRYQRLDAASVQWLVDRGKPVATAINAVVPDYAPLPRDLLALKSSWFASREITYGIHGVRHLIRVALYAWIILQKERLQTEVSPADIRKFIMVALLHDIRRLNDNADAEHGRRSAAWIKATRPDTPTWIIAAVEFHVDDTLPRLDDTSLRLLKVLKTADALDRFRLPKEKWWPDTTRMPLVVDDKLLQLCKYVTIRTEEATLGPTETDKIIDKLTQWLAHEKLI